VQKLDESHPVLTNLISGATAGSFAQTVTYPLDVVRRREQARPSSGNRGVVRKMAAIVRSEGVRGLYRGIGLTYLKAAPAIAISFTTFDYLSELWGVPKGRFSATA